MRAEPTTPWECFRRLWKTCGWDEAIAWLHIVKLPDEVKDAIRVRAGRENLAALKVDPNDYRRNRRRAGAFE